MNGGELDEVQAFLLTFEEGSFTAAGRSIARDASVVSRRVSALEARLGVRLFERSTRHLAPTEAGTVYHGRMRAALRMMDEATAEVGQSHNIASGQLRLALPATFGKRWIAPALPEFLSRWPKVTIEAEFSDRYVDLIHERFDLAIRIGDLADSRLVARKIAENDRILVAAPGYIARYGQPDTPDQLASHACLANSRLQGYPKWRFRNGKLASTIEINGPMVADDTESLVAAAVAGIGVTVSARWLIAGEIARGELVPILPGWRFEQSGSIQIVRPSVRYTPVKTQIFVDWVIEKFERPPWDA